MKRPIVNIGDNLRVVLEVLDRGTVKVSLEKRKDQHVGTHSWEPVDFKWWPVKNGYIVKSPGLLEKVLGITFKRKIERAVKKCRKAAHRIFKARSIVRLLSPTPDREQRIVNIISEIALYAKERLIAESEFQFTPENDDRIKHSVRACGASVYNAIRTAADPEEQELDPEVANLQFMVAVASNGNAALVPIDETEEEPSQENQSPPDRFGELIFPESPKDEDE